MKIQFAPEITIGLGSVLLALKNRSSYLRIQARAPRSLKNPKSKQGRAENIEAMEPNVTKGLLLRTRLRHDRGYLWVCKHDKFAKTRDLPNNV